ncbi:MAG: threonine/serine dehydratase [Tepidanaerobacteraceae bacterium]|nr:threonine/serine dehydratase [Tepidanaerobacteraceae bacterium]
MIYPKDVYNANRQIQHYIYRTPLEKSFYLSEVISGEVFLKLECQQLLKAYKIRGALNKLLSLSPQERSKGIITASSGNHGASVSYAGNLLGIKSVNVYVPTSTPEIKKEKISRYGAKLIVKGNNYDETYSLAQEASKQEDYVWIDSCSDDIVIAGQGTIGIEMMEDQPDIDTILVPIGGGGMITGISVVAKSINPKIKVIGVQTDACPAMLAAIRDNIFYKTYPTKPSVCEALVGGVGEIPFNMAKDCIDDIMLVKEETIKQAVMELIQHDKVLAEPSATVGVACLLEHGEFFKDKKVGVVISGDNIDFGLLTSFFKEVV